MEGEGETGRGGPLTQQQVQDLAVIPGEDPPWGKGGEGGGRIEERERKMAELPGNMPKVRLSALLGRLPLPWPGSEIRCQERQFSNGQAHCPLPLHLAVYGSISPDVILCG